MYRCGKCVTTHTEQIDHISSREHAWPKSWKAQDLTSLCPETSVIYVSCLTPCRTRHRPQAQVLTHLPHLSFRQSSVHDPYLPCEDPRQSGGSTQIPSLTLCGRALVPLSLSQDEIFGGVHCTRVDCYRSPSSSLHPTRPLGLVGGWQRLGFATLGVQGCRGQFFEARSQLSQRLQHSALPQQLTDLTVDGKLTF